MNSEFLNELESIFHTKLDATIHDWLWIIPRLRGLTRESKEFNIPYKDNMGRDRLIGMIYAVVTTCTNATVDKWGESRGVGEYMCRYTQILDGDVPDSKQELHDMKHELRSAFLNPKLILEEPAYMDLETFMKTIAPILETNQIK
jgi:hypothetical protein